MNAILSVYDMINVCFTNLIYQYINVFVTQYSIIKTKNKNVVVFVLNYMLLVLFYSNTMLSNSGIDKQ